MPVAESPFAAADGLAHAKRARIFLVAAVLAAAATLPHRIARADEVFEANPDLGTVGAYSTTGGSSNPSLITLPSGEVIPEYYGSITAYNGDLFVSWDGNFPISGIAEYTTSGALVNASLITNAGGVTGFNGNLLVGVNNGVAEYATSGALINSVFLTPPSGDVGLSVIGVSGGNIYAETTPIGGGSNTVIEYNSSGALINDSLISGPAGPFFMAPGGLDMFTAGAEYTLSGALVPSFSIDVPGGYVYGDVAVTANDLYLSVGYNAGGYGVAEYTTSGALVNLTVFTYGDTLPGGLAIVATPEPSTWILMALGALALFVFRCCGRPMR